MAKKSTASSPKKSAQKKSAPTTRTPLDTTPDKGTVRARLAELTGPAEDESVATYTARLAAESHTTQVAANLSRIKLGVALQPYMPKKSAGRGAWELTEAERLGIKPRQLRTILTTAQIVLAVELPIAVLDRPLERVRAAALAVAKGRDPDAEAVKREPRAAGEVWGQVVAKAVKALGAFGEEEREARVEEMFGALRGVAG